MLAAARDLLAQRGLAALTMRTLAKRLRVSPNALYSHVASKNALLDDLLDALLAEVREPPPDLEEPGSGLHALMASTYAVLLTHPDLVPLYLARRGARGPNAQRLGDVMLALLARAGVTGDDALEARRVLIVYTIGFAAFVTSPPLEPSGHAAPSAADLVENFHAGLRWLLAGITAP